MTVLVFLSQKRNFCWKLQTVLPHFVVQQDWEEKQTLLFLCGRNCRDFYVVTQKLNLMRFYPFGRFLTHTKLHFPALIFLFFYFSRTVAPSSSSSPWEVQKFQAQDVPRCVNRYFNQWIKMINLNLVQNASWAALHISSTWVLTRIRGSRCASGSSLGSLWTLNNPSLGLGVSWQFPHQGTFRCENSSRNNLQGFAAKSLGWKAEGEGESSRLGSSRRISQWRGSMAGTSKHFCTEIRFSGCCEHSWEPGQQVQGSGDFKPKFKQGEGELSPDCAEPGSVCQGDGNGFCPFSNTEITEILPPEQGSGKLCQINPWVSITSQQTDPWAHHRSSSLGIKMMGRKGWIK